MKAHHEAFMRLAMEEAKKGEGRTSPYPSVGCVVVRAGKVIGRGYTQPQALEHAEASVLKKLGDKARGATLYSTLEPCHHNDHKESQPCDQWIAQARIRHVVWGASDPNLKNKEGSTRWLKRKGITVTPKILQKDCEQLHEIFLISLAKKRPFVFVSTAASLDGKITWKKNALPVKFSSPQALKRVHELRNRADAIMVGIGTVEIDNPRLTARVSKANNPHRIIVDAHCRLPLDAKVFDASSGTVIVLTTAYSPLLQRTLLEEKGAQVIVVKEVTSNMVDLRDGLKRLYEMGITSVMIEGGGELIASALYSKLVDKIYFWYSPMLLGGRETPTLVEGSELGRFNDAIAVTSMQSEVVGRDILITGYPEY